MNDAQIIESYQLRIRELETEIVKLKEEQVKLVPLDEDEVLKCLEEPVYQDKHMKMYVAFRDKPLIVKAICSRFGLPSRKKVVEKIRNEINKWLHKHLQQHLEYDDLANAIADEVFGGE